MDRMASPLPPVNRRPKTKGSAAGRSLVSEATKEAGRYIFFLAAAALGFLLTFLTGLVWAGVQGATHSPAIF